MLRKSFKSFFHLVKGSLAGIVNNAHITSFHSTSYTTSTVKLYGRGSVLEDLQLIHGNDKLDGFIIFSKENPDKNWHTAHIRAHIIS